MAKVNAPLFSFNASGKIANALVYFCWKGIDVVRSYVVPTNPKSEDQRTQRGYLREAVKYIHDVQAASGNPLTEDDRIALALLSSTRPNPRTWFNEAVKNWVDRLVASKYPAIFSSGEARDILATTATLRLFRNTATGKTEIGDVNFWYGVSKTALVNKTDDVSITAPFLYTADLTELTPATKYFWQLRVKAAELGGGNVSGIYHFTTPAA